MLLGNDTADLALLVAVIGAAGAVVAQVVQTIWQAFRQRPGGHQAAAHLAEVGANLADAGSDLSAGLAAEVGRLRLAVDTMRQEHDLHRKDMAEIRHRMSATEADRLALHRQASKLRARVDELHHHIDNLEQMMRDAGMDPPPRPGGHNGDS